MPQRRPNCTGQDSAVYTVYRPTNTALRISAYETDRTDGLREVQNRLFTVCKTVGTLCEQRRRTEAQFVYSLQGQKNHHLPDCGQIRL